MKQSTNKSNNFRIHRSFLSSVRPSVHPYKHKSTDHLITSSHYLFHKRKRLVVDDGRASVGHGQNHGDATRQRSRCARGEVLLVRRARFPNVNVHINEAG